MKKQLEEIVNNAVKNPSFKEKLKQNPKKTIEQECQIQLPEDVSVIILENSPKKVYFVLPIPNLPGEEGELFQKLRDPVTRKEFKSNPRAFLEKNGVFIPKERQIEVIEDEPRKLYLVIPMASEMGALTDKQLEAISGGFPPLLLGVPIVLAIGAIAGYGAGKLATWIHDKVTGKG